MLGNLSVIIKDSSDDVKESSDVNSENCKNSDEDESNNQLSFDRSAISRGPSMRFINESCTDLKKHGDGHIRTPTKNIVLSKFMQL